MNILILGKEKFGEMFTSSENISLESFKPSRDDAFDYDKWLSQKTDEFLNKKPFDLIILPYSISEHNFAEFSGLRIAAFIRLSNNKENSRKPILFMGPENTTVVTKMSDLGSILFTPFVFFTQKRLTSDTIEGWANRYLGDYIGKCMTDDQYLTFLNRFHINPPARFDNRHSIANEWAIYRWSKLLELKSESPFMFTLYARKQFAEEWHYQNIDKWIKKNHTLLDSLKIDNLIEDCTIRYIDDEYRGWDPVFKKLFLEKSSRIDYDCFKDFNPTYSREELLSKLKSYIDDNPANCYIVDLRLHEKDHDEKTQIEDITGHGLIKYILNKNRGTRIVLFTASNKTWNTHFSYQLKTTTGTVYEICIKESPEQNFSVKQSYDLIANFLLSVSHACQESYIQKYIDTCERMNTIGLEGFLDTLVLDKTLDKKQSLKVLLLLLVFFVEDYIRRKFYVSDAIDENNSFRLNTQDGNFSKPLVKQILRLKYTDYSIFNKEVQEFVFIATEDKSNDEKYSWAKPQKGNGEVYLPTLIVSALKYYYAITPRNINILMAAIRERNRIAHENAECRLRIDDIKEIFENIVVPIISFDYNTNK